ncbi:MAG: colanic acid exporter [Methanomassiliicoccales archaeon PtaU1.Bin124]|nr:MAG: colanic acid exporter [Methanomassiliicoccales archaeon PtaU1.Bin124]
MLARKSFLILLSRLTSQALSFIALLFVWKYLGTDLYGGIVFSMSLVALFNCISDLGFNTAAIKRISEGADQDDCVSTFATIKLGLTGLMVVATLISIVFYEFVIGKKLTDTNIQLILIFIGYYVFYDLAGIALYTFDAKMESAKSLAIYLADPIVRVPFVILVAMNRMTVNDLAYTYLLGSMAIFAVAVILMLRSGIRWKRPTMYRSFLTFAAPLAFASVFTVAWNYITPVLLGLFGTNIDVSYYSSANTLMGILSTVGAAVGTITFPLFSKYFTEGRLDQIKLKTYEAERYIGIIILPLVLIMVLFPYTVADVIFSPKYHSAGGPLQILAIIAALGLMNQAYNSHFCAVNRPDINLKLTVLSLVLNTALLLIFVPTSIMGIKLLGFTYMGAVYAGLITAIVIFIATRYIVKELTQTSSNPRILFQLAAILCTGIILILLSWLYAPTRWYDLVIFTLLAFGLFIGFLALMKEFTRNDLNYLLEIADAKEMWQYIKTELGGKG